MIGRLGPILASLAVGIGIGLITGWVLWPVEYANADLADLKPAYKDDFIRMISAAYSLNGNAAAAKQRLSSLGLANPAQVMNDLIAREASTGNELPRAALYQLERLVAPSQPSVASSSATFTSTIPAPTNAPSAVATNTPTSSTTPAASATETVSLAQAETPTATIAPTVLPAMPDLGTVTVAVSDSPTETATLEPPSLSPTATALPTGTLAPSPSPSIPPSPTATATPTPLPTVVLTATLPPKATAAPSPTFALFPFRVVEKTSLSCVDLPDDALLIFYVRDWSDRGIPNIGIEIRFANGDDTVYTGLKPERGVGYADFKAQPGTYSVSLIDGQSDTVSNLIVGDPVSDCRSDHGITKRGWRLVFQK